MLRAALLVAAIPALVPGTRGASPPSAKEYQVKAVFLFNFTQFVHWPDAAFAASGTPIKIAVLGDDPFGAALDEAAAGERVGGRPVVVERFRSPDRVPACHILFVSDSAAGDLDRVLAQVKDRPVLTVSDLPGFARRGGVIHFFREGAKIRFEINPVAAQAKGLKLSSQLLSLARLVPGENEPMRP